MNAAPTNTGRIAGSVVEQAALDWLGELGYEVLSGLVIAPGETAAERADYKQVFLFDRLQTKLKDLNPQIPLEGLQEALRKIRLISHPTLIENNRAFHRLLVEGVDGEFRNRDGQIVNDKVWAIDFANPEANEFLAVNQFTVEEGHFNRRADVVVFINGIPLAVLELKSIADEQATIREAFDQCQTYKAQIPSLFHSNALLVISDGHETRLGTVTSDWERFMTWRTITGKELVAPGSLQLETMLKGVFEKAHLLDLVRNFIVFEDDGEKVTKKLAGYHQFHAVDKAVATTVEASRVTGDRRAGVIWHSQGSGKSLSMVFYAGKIVQHAAMENPTVVVLTDRNDLDDQLFDTLDKPMRGHGLMQAIARVNRVFKDKPGGLVVDYLGLAEELKQALADYSNSKGKGDITLDQEEAVAVMLEKYEQVCAILHGFDYEAAAAATAARRLPLIAQAVEHVLQQKNGKPR